jgi:hypothetical protein
MRLALTLLGIAACNDSVSHIYAGRQYEPTAKCVDAPSTIDVVTGNDPGATCGPICLVAPPTSTGATTTYVSNECAPYPPLFDTSGNGANCAAAITAYDLKTDCDAGSD